MLLIFALKFGSLGVIGVGHRSIFDFFLISETLE
jgi:hypothetical protein